MAAPSQAAEVWQLRQVWSALEAPAAEPDWDLKPLLDFLRKPATGDPVASLLKSADHLERYAPFEWPAIDRTLCVAADLPAERCLSLDCLMLDAAPEEHRH